MEITAIDSQTGIEHPVCVEECATVASLAANLAGVLGYDSGDVTLCIGGTELEGQDPSDAPLLVSQCGAIEGGCRVEVIVGGTHFVPSLLSGEVEYRKLPEWARGSKVCAIAAVTHKPHALFFAPQALRGDKEVVMTAVSHGLALHFASSELLHDKDVVLAAVSTDASCFAHLPESAVKLFCGEKDIMLLVVKKCGSYLQAASAELRADKEVVLAAIDGGEGYALEHASEALKGDREVVLEAVSCHGLALKWASAELQGDMDVAMAAVSEEGQSLQYASEELKSNRTVVVAAVRNEGRAIRYASAPLRDDKEIALIAVSKQGVLHCVGGLMQADKDVVLRSVKKDGDSIKFASVDLQNDPDVVYALEQSCDSDRDSGSEDS